MLMMPQCAQDSLSTHGCSFIASPIASCTPFRFTLASPAFPPLALAASSPLRLSELHTFPASCVNKQRKAVALPVLALKTPKGFGPVPKKKKSSSSQKLGGSDEEEEDEVDEDEEDNAVPEVVTNRMLKRIAFTVGAPLGVGVLFFPLFYYLKVVLKVDFPEWIPVVTSMIMFGTAGLGITYGVVSTSWDPLREGSLLGWKEAQANWPVFWQTVQGKQDKRAQIRRFQQSNIWLCMKLVLLLLFPLYFRVFAVVSKTQKLLCMQQLSNTLEAAV